MKIREASLNYATARKWRLENRENWLEEEVLALENKLNKRNVSDKVKENIRTGPMGYLWVTKPEN